MSWEAWVLGHATNLHFPSKPPRPHHGRIRANSWGLAYCFLGSQTSVPLRRQVMSWKQEVGELLLCLSGCWHAMWPSLCTSVLLAMKAGIGSIISVAPESCDSAGRTVAFRWTVKQPKVTNSAISQPEYFTVNVPNCRRRNLECDSPEVAARLCPLLWDFGQVP